MKFTTSLVSLALVSTAYAANETLWGPYRSNLYFGLRPRIPQSLMTGLVWFGTHDYTAFGKARHACDQGDGLQSYSWTEYDPRRGGIQVLEDTPNNVKITTEFLKVPGGNHGGSWAARIKGEPIQDSIPTRTSMIFYFGLEGIGGMDMDTEEDQDGIEGPVKFSGSTPELDDFTIRIVDGPDNEALTNGVDYNKFRERVGKSHFITRPVQNGQMWQAKEILMQNIIQRANEILEPFKDGKGGIPPDPSYVLQFSNDAYMGSNLFAVQKVFDGSFQFDVFFDSKSAKTHLDASTFDEGMTALKASFDQQFTAHLSEPSAYPSADPAALQAFSKAITSSLIGGVGYFYGTSIVDNKFAYEWDAEDEDSDNDEDKTSQGAHLTEPKALLTATPSRSFFPRGFYWDEGFHLVHIGLFDNDFSLEILQDWINLIDDNGWVAREQILGEEARSKVPAEFQTQIPSYANPPTLPMALTAFIKRFKETSLSGPSDAELGMDFGTGQTPLGSNTKLDEAGSQHLQNSDKAISYLKSLYEPLKRHYDWFRRTQRGQIKQYSREARSRTEAYRWRGRSETHVLTSGMDDYPRGPPHAGELHVDLISWMAFFSRTMREIAEFIGEEEDASTYADLEKAIINNIDDLHWNEEQQMYCDANVNDDDESYHVCHKGYLSLFPLMLGLLEPNSPHLEAVLNLVHDPEELWSPYGIRSLSISHPEFGQGENYWKGPIWIQMNYLVLQALHNRYTKEDGPYQEKARKIYNELRANIIDNTFKEYQRTGFVWEQYDSKTGNGQRNHPFTGWTSLVSLIISEKY
ncbi:glycoside hydrolase [Flagelloscypha sp. PMI_526]|nr:glycoside hydrolase [Flagelloscypha sp. PMI_526]